MEQSRQRDLTSHNKDKLEGINGIPEKLESMFIRNIGHELRTPLTIIQGYAELLRNGDLGSLAPEQKNAIFAIVDRAYEMRTMVERIGILMEIEANRSTVVPVRLGGLVEDVLKEKEEAIAQAGLELSVSIDKEGLQLVPGDPYQLQHAIGSILDNAIKFTTRGGHVGIKVYKEEPNYACVSISDTGIGIREEDMKHIFARFYQADSSHTRRHGGIGLGLALVDSVVKNHSGKIEVDSKPGEGSRFTMKLPTKLPIELPVMPPDAQVSERDDKMPTTLKRILIVDDEVNLAEILRDGLEQLSNCEIAVATNAKDALKLIEEGCFDLLITDYKMPDMDGLTLAKEIRQLCPRISIIMITAYSDNTLRDRAIRISIQRVLDKPVRLKEIRNAASEALKKPENKKGEV